MSKKDWQVGPVLKEKAGSQGTLFRGGTRYSSDARYPRGYTPERQAEVREQIQPTRLSGSFDPVGSQQQRARIADTVARSTAPVAHLQGLQWAHVNPGEAITVGDTAAGAYFESRDVKEGSVAAERAGGVYRSPAMVAVKPEYDRTGTVLHEIGHHVSHEIEQTEHSRPGNYSHESAHGGAEEAFADNYAEQHFRDRRGRQVERGTYGGGQWAGRIQRSESFWKSYHQNRDNTLYHASVDKQNEDFYRKWPEEKPHPDGSMDVPLITKEYVSEDDHARGVKPESDINYEALPHWSHKYSW
jgi:hypothetical protein